MSERKQVFVQFHDTSTSFCNIVLKPGTENCSGRTQCNSQENLASRTAEECAMMLGSVYKPVCSLCVLLIVPAVDYVGSTAQNLWFPCAQVILLHNNNVGEQFY